MKTDLQLQQDVQAELVLEPYVNATQIGVETMLAWSSIAPVDSTKAMVEMGLVALPGQVHWEFEGRTAASGIRHLRGITGASDQITIKQETSASIVKADIYAALKRRAQNDAQMISVEAKGTAVTLSGIAHTWAKWDLASHAAWSAPSVNDVVDKIKVSYRTAIYIRQRLSC